VLSTYNQAVALVVGSGGSEEETKLGEALGLAYLVTAIKTRMSTMEVVLLNAIIDAELREIRADHSDELADARRAAQHIAQLNPVLCGISMIYRTQKPWTMAFVQELRALGYTGHIIIGGMYPTSAWETILRDIPEVDSVCIGEGDQLIGKLIDELVLGSDWRSLVGLGWRDQHGQPQRATEAVVRIRDVGLRVSTKQLNRTITPDRGQLARVVELGGVIQVEASRGCDAGCVFCDARHTVWRPRPVEQLVDELEELSIDYPGVLIYMIDNIFLGFSNDGSHLERGRQLAQAIIDRGISIRFVIQDRAANIDYQTFQLLKQAGLCEIYVGIESFSASQLKRLRKGADATPQANLLALSTLTELQIYTQFGYLPFDEGVSWEELVESVAGLKAAVTGNPWLHVSNFNELIPYEGTYLEGLYEQQHGEAPPEVDPWVYSDPRILRLRAWAWCYSTALWPVTGLVFNKVQDPEYQRDLWRTLETKNRLFVEFLQDVMKFIEQGWSQGDIEAHFSLTMDIAASSLAESVSTWLPGAAQDQVLQAISTIDAQQALQYNPDPGC
jgi:hypothetical protein